MISVRSLEKHYRVHERKPGLAAAVRALVSREYKVVRAVDGIDFEIAAGESVAFLGPNGAGKTTTLKILSGLVHPTSGHVRVLGFEPRRREHAFLRAVTLVMGQKQQLIWDLPPAETFELNRAIYGLDRTIYAAFLSELVELLALGDVVRRPTRQLSLGERMKCEVVASLLHQPEVLFFDEPTIGLDVSMQASLREFIKRYCARLGATLLLTSHDMADVGMLCKRAIVIQNGAIVFDAELADLGRSLRPVKRITLRLASVARRDAFESLGEIVAIDGEYVSLQVPSCDVTQVVSRVLAAFTVVDLSVVDPPLEEIMRSLFDAGNARGAE